MFMLNGAASVCGQPFGCSALLALPAMISLSKRRGSSVRVLQTA